MPGTWASRRASAPCVASRTFRDPSALLRDVRISLPGRVRMRYRSLPLPYMSIPGIHAMTRESTETPPSGGPLNPPAPDDAREADASPEEVLPVPEPEQETPPMSAFTETLTDETLDNEPLETTAVGHTPDIDPAKLDPDGLKVIHRLHAHGHQAYFVGGCVRDLLLERTPKDFDIATSAHPNEVRAIFRNCRLIGRRFRLAHVYFKGGKIIEVSTFRANPTELEPPNGEGSPEEEGAEGSEESQDLLITHDNVFGTAEQDARRLDFT